MNLSFLRPLYQSPGPWASVYLDATHNRTDSDQAILLRWRALREELADQGADEETLVAMDIAVNPDQGVAPGRVGLAVFASGGRVALAEPLPQPPPVQVATWSPRPQTGMLLSTGHEQVQWVRAVVDRTGAQLTAVDSGRLRINKAVSGSQEYPIHVSEQGGWAQARYERSANVSWDRNAKDVVPRLTAIVDALGADIIIVAGDVRARQFLIDRLPARLSERVVESDTGSRALGAEQQHLDDVTAQEVARVSGHRRCEVLDRYRMDLAKGFAAQGMPAVTEAAWHGAPAFLLLSAGAELPMLWVDPDDFRAVATDPQVLRDAGVQRPEQETADAALIGAAAATDADAFAIDLAEERLLDGVGAILRYQDRSARE
ncbi:Vms1/Ankzf1 family peptidyl-tRNA hydrolase [Rugosimonospora acidiphila]|uniref:Vms1/Ankzf1 family peptidyl-tRNA hydrolase n=1 Tax=Rugosimonospora acidiphila TaxID=556531 RepID=A0ABP9RPA2_9ACTN